MKTKIFYVLSVFNAVVLTFLFFSFTKKDNLSTLNFEDKIIKVKGVVVVDSKGVERVIIGANLPEPNNVNGNRRQSRGASGVSGVMLYDNDGIERGGYVTDDFYGNAIITLDSPIGMNFIAGVEPQGGAFLRLNDLKNKNKVSLFAFEDEAYIDITNEGVTKKVVPNEK